MVPDAGAVATVQGGTTGSGGALAGSDALVNPISLRQIVWHLRVHLAQVAEGVGKPLNQVL